MSDLVVPDAIEPVIGYKALRVDPEGNFFSPRQLTEWPCGQRLEATCTALRFDWKWVATKDTPHPWCNPHQPGTVLANHWAVVPTPPDPQPQPQTVLPAGMAWSWEAVKHEAVQNDCGCGIYALNSPEACIGYATPDSVIVQVALWGRTINASQGARAQYAYPQKIVSTMFDHDRVERAAANYGIPLKLDSELPSYPSRAGALVVASGGLLSTAMPNFQASRGVAPFAGPAPTSSSPSSSDLSGSEVAAFAICALIVLAGFAGLALSSSWLARILVAIPIALAALVAGVGVGVTTERE